MIRRLLDETEAAGGLAPLDVARFWEDNAIAARDPFDSSIPQVPLGVMMSEECVFASCPSSNEPSCAGLVTMESLEYGCDRARSARSKEECFASEGAHTTPTCDLPGRPRSGNARQDVSTRPR